MIHSRYTSTATATTTTKALVVGDLEQDSSQEEAVQDMIRRTLESLDFTDDPLDFDFEDAGYGTDDSWDVTRRRWARNHKSADGKTDNPTGSPTGNPTGDAVMVRRRRPVVHRGPALANLPGVPWPYGNQDVKVNNDNNDDDDEVAALAAQQQTRQRSLDYFRSKQALLLPHHTSESSLVSPDSVLSFTLASRGQQQQQPDVWKSSSIPATTTATTTTATTTTADATTTITTPCRSATTKSHY
jgi:hypothetical protein